MRVRLTLREGASESEPALNERDEINFSSDGGVLRPGFCRVVWVRTEGSDGLGEAGLELLSHPAARG
jgi:hypothetical protein